MFQRNVQKITNIFDFELKEDRKEELGTGGERRVVFSVSVSLPISSVFLLFLVCSREGEEGIHNGVGEGRRGTRGRVSRDEKEEIQNKLLCTRRRRRREKREKGGIMERRCACWKRE